MIIQKEVCPLGECSACGSCVQICPAKCISFIKNNHETSYAVYEQDKCFFCNKCKKSCPQISLSNGKFPQKAYAAWSRDNETRTNSASGGIATELYRFYALNNGLFAGVELKKNFRAVYRLLEKKDDYSMFQNSKYVESFTEDIFIQIGDKLRNGKQILFIGLPCHIAGIKGYLKTQNISDSNIVFVDLICHGITPVDFLSQHICNIESKKTKKCTQVFFRDPQYGTNSFIFSLHDDKSVFYKKKVHSNDTYQIGYHYGLTYRDNCYNCRYACPQRQGDLTLSDFSGLGRKKEWDQSRHNISCVLVNSEKGERLLKAIFEQGLICCEERPLEEALMYEKQLMKPTEIRMEHLLFLSKYEKTHDFDRSMKSAARKLITINELNEILKVKEIKRAVFKIISPSIKQCIKDFICK